MVDSGKLVVVFLSLGLEAGRLAATLKPVGEWGGSHLLVVGGPNQLGSSHLLIG